MADQEQLARLQFLIEAWNAWRFRYPRAQIDLKKADLSGADLRGANLSGADLKEANLSGADLQEVDFSGSNLSEANLSEANLSEADLSRAHLRRSDLRGTDLTRVNLSETDLSGTDLRGANFNRSDFVGTDLRGANLSGTDLSGTDLKGANLSGADLSGTDLREFDLRGVDLRGANLSGADLTRADLSGVNLRRADLSNVTLLGTQVLATNFRDSTFTGACLKDWNTNRFTCLETAQADFIYLGIDGSDSFSERRPHSGNFKSGEFAALFQQALNTLDLIFVDGIDWQSFFASFQELRQQHGDADLNIQAIEKKSGGSFVVKLEVNEQADKAALQQSWEGIYEENQQLKAQLLRTEGKLEGYKEQLSDFQQKVLQGMSENQPVIHNNFGNAKIGNFANQMSGNASMSATQNIYAADPKTPAEAAKEIHDLLVQLAQDNPLATDDDRAEHIRQALPPTRLQRSVEILQTAGEAAVESLPGGKVVTAVLKKVREQEEVQRKAQS